MKVEENTGCLTLTCLTCDLTFAGMTCYGCGAVKPETSQPEIILSTICWCGQEHN